MYTKHKIPLEIFGFQEVFLFIRMVLTWNSWEWIRGNYSQIRLTHVLTHNRIAPSGRISFIESNGRKTNTPKNWKLFGRVFLRPIGITLAVQNLSFWLPQARGEVFLVYFILLVTAWRQQRQLQGGFIILVSRTDSVMSYPGFSCCIQLLQWGSLRHKPRSG